MKRVIVIKGSEDGVIGVAGNLKRAVEIANEANYLCTYKDALKSKNDYFKRHKGLASSDIYYAQVDINKGHVEFDAYILNK